MFEFSKSFFSPYSVVEASQLMFAFFAAVNHLSRPLREQFTSMGSKGPGLLVICDWWILIPFVCFSVSRFIACDVNYD